MLKHPAFIIVLLTVSCVSYIILGLIGDVRSEIEKYWVIIFPIYLVYFLIIISILKDKLPQNISPLWFILTGIIFRIVLIPSEPFLSDDIFRYLWDGKIVAAGINPYKFAPTDIHLLEYRDEIVYPNINFPGIATSYPPVSQFMFLLNNWLGGSVLSWKLMLLTVEIFLVLIILKLLPKFGLGQNRLLIYFFNPLLIIETYSSGHLEIIGVFFFWLAVYLFYKNFDWNSVIVIALSIMTKFIPLISGIPFLIKKFYRRTSLLILTCTLLLIPFMFSGIVPLPGLFSYLNRWEFNGGIYQLTTSLMKLLDVKEYQWMVQNLSGHLEIFYINHALYYKVFVLFILVVVLIDQLNKLRATSRFRSINFIQRSFILTAVFLLLTPTLHPWYLIWIIPFLIFIPNWSWIGLTLLIQISYFVLKDFALISEWKESLWVLLAQYVPFYLVLIWEYLDRRRIKGWFVS
jgi:hypothetical protein